jgi:hypothetical protein
MRILVIGLGLVLGCVLIDRMGRGRPARPRSRQSYPFPTTESHRAIDSFEFDAQAPRWAHELGCSEAELRDAVAQVGMSVERIRDRLKERAR